MPKELLPKCFENFYTAHTKGADYHDNWYDAIGMDETEKKYYFKTPAVKDGDFYITVETYAMEVVP